MSTSYTRGPWVALLGDFDFSNDGQRRVMCGHPEGNDYRLLADVNTCAVRKRHGKNRTPYNAPDAERDANARLIAAAPELLEALRDIEISLRAGGSHNLADIASRAIARATGETP